MEKLVSIITVSYNSEETIERTIQSVLNQGYKNIEYIIVDGSSKDKTVEKIKKYEEVFKRKEYSYKYISEKDNGIYDAMNKGIKMASGEIIGLINSDDWYENDAIENIVDFYTKHNDDIVYGNLKVISPKKSFIKKGKNNFYFTTRGWTHPTMFVKKEIYNEMNYRCQSIYDDLDFILRAKNKKYKIGVVDKVISNFSFGGVSTKKDLNRTIKDIKLRNKIYLQNGYSKLHCVDNLLIELLKYVIS